MSKIAFLMSSLNSGGVENALCNFIQFLRTNFSNLEIDILLIKKEGIFLEKINGAAKIVELDIPENDKALLFIGGFKRTFTTYLKKGKILSIMKIFYNRLIKKQLFFDLIELSKYKKIQTKYDYLVVYTAHMPFLIRYGIDKIDADNKYLWIHNDFATTNYHLEYMKRDIEKFDKIFSVSNQLKEEFETLFSSMIEKSYLFHNILPCEDIRAKAMEPIEEFDENSFNILSIGRLDYQKGFDYAIEIAKKMKKSGLKFCWYIIGEGKERTRLQKLIKLYELRDNFVLLGVRKNPYPYIRNCNLYVQPSRHEGYCTTVVEAKLLGKYIISTEVAGAHEILDSYKNSEIVKFDVNLIEKAITKFYFSRKNIIESKQDNGKYNYPEYLIAKEVFKL